jgi:hypothetical protein
VIVIDNPKIERKTDTAMTLTEQQEKLATHLWGVTRFCVAHKGKALPWLKDDINLLFRYVASCFYHGKLNIVCEDGVIKAVVFAWCDWRERIEAKAAENKPQFDWSSNGRGDSLFVADVVGSRESVGKLYQATIDKYPQLVAVPWFTYRRGVLVQIPRAKLERFSRKAVK